MQKTDHLNEQVSASLDIIAAHACIVHSGSTSPEYIVVSFSLRLYLVLNACNSGAIMSIFFARVIPEQKNTEAPDAKLICKTLSGLREVMHL